MVLAVFRDHQDLPQRGVVQRLLPRHRLATVLIRSGLVVVSAKIAGTVAPLTWSTRAVRAAAEGFFFGAEAAQSPFHFKVVGIGKVAEGIVGGEPIGDY